MTEMSKLFVGYHLIGGYKLFNPSINKAIISKDVIFYEIKLGNGKKT